MVGHSQGSPQCPTHRPSFPLSVLSLSPQCTREDSPRDSHNVPHKDPHSLCPSCPLVPREPERTVSGIAPCPTHGPSFSLSILSPSPQGTREDIPRDTHMEPSLPVSYLPLVLGEWKDSPRDLPNVLWNEVVNQDVK